MSIPTRLEDLIEEYGTDGNPCHGRNSRIFVDEENQEVWKIVPEYDQNSFKDDQSVYEAAGVKTPSNRAANTDLSEYNLGNSLVVNQNLVENYKSFLSLPTEKVANDLVDIADNIINQGYSLDFGITNFGVRSDKEIVYLDDANPYSLTKPPSIDKMWLDFKCSAADLDGDYGEIAYQVKDSML